MAYILKRRSLKERFLCTKIRTLAGGYTGHCIVRVIVVVLVRYSRDRERTFGSITRDWYHYRKITSRTDADHRIILASNTVIVFTNDRQDCPY
jgi:K+ transporter